MKEYKYIIVGGGMAGSAAVAEIRKNDVTGSIALFTKEKFGPYNRPPLSKGLWDGKEINDIMRPMDKYDIDMHIETSIIKISRKEKTVTDERAQQYKYQKLLLATGGHPIHLPNSPKGVIFYRTRSDFQMLKDLVQEKSEFCVIGGGFIGSEIAAALTKQNKRVTMIFPESGISGVRFPNDLAEFLNDYYREKGVTILNGNLVDSIEKQEKQYQVKYKKVNSDIISEKSFDAVIIGIGIKPNVSLAEDADLNVEDGIVVNEFLQTNDPSIFAAGDNAYFKNFGLGKRVRVEHEDNANKMGTLAGCNMSSDLEKYDHFPFFYSDLFDLGYEAIGDLDKNYNIVEDWIDPFKKGTIFYLHDDKIRGLIFWNLWGQVDKGRDIISKGQRYKLSDLEGLFTED